MFPEVVPPVPAVVPFRTPLTPALIKSPISARRRKKRPITLRSGRGHKPAHHILSDSSDVVLVVTVSKCAGPRNRANREHGASRCILGQNEVGTDFTWSPLPPPSPLYSKAMPYMSPNSPAVARMTLSAGVPRD